MENIYEKLYEIGLVVNKEVSLKKKFTEDRSTPDAR